MSGLSKLGNEYISLGKKLIDPGGFIWKDKPIRDAQADAQQAVLSDLLLQRARGEGPSAAQELLRAGQERTMGAALAMARSARGNPFLALRQAQEAQAGTMSEQAGQAAMLRAQEQIQAAQTLGAILAHQQDLALQQEQARQQQRAGLFQAGASIASMVAAA